MRATYRNDDEGVRLHIESLLERYQEQSQALAEPLRLLYARRVARVLAGKVAVGGTALLALFALFAMIRGETFSVSRSHASMPLAIGRGGLSYILMAVVAAVAIAYQVGLLLARGDLAGKLVRAVPRTGDAHHDLACLEAASPDRELRRLLAGLERRSIALPLVGALMLAPIALHFALYVVFYVIPTIDPRPLDGFDDWIGYSVLLVTHAQLVTAYMGLRYAQRAAATEGLDELKALATGSSAAFGLAVGVSLFPGGALFMIPPVIVALTAGAVVLPAFSLARSRLIAERELLAA